MKQVVSAIARQHSPIFAGLLLSLAMVRGKGTVVYQQFEISIVNGWPVIGLPSDPYNLDMDGNGTTDFGCDAASRSIRSPRRTHSGIPPSMAPCSPTR